MRQRIEFFHFWRTLFRVIIGTTQLPADSEIFFIFVFRFDAERETDRVLHGTRSCVCWMNQKSKQNARTNRTAEKSIHSWCKNRVRLVRLVRCTCKCTINRNDSIYYSFGVRAWIRKMKTFPNETENSVCISVYTAAVRCWTNLKARFRMWVSAAATTVMAAALSTQLFCSTCFCVSIAPEALGLKLWSRKKNCFTFSAHSLALTVWPIHGNFASSRVSIYISDYSRSKAIFRVGFSYFVFESSVRETETRRKC